jgi:hypothetical protein
LCTAAFSIAPVRVQADEVILLAELYSVDDGGGAVNLGLTSKGWFGHLLR